mmetsp:Transcript_66027/g.76693  ORF Transcript_66027/g.76693 Transcript_66027/m.76693 type:complete len:197 (+) Transcript_66027:20-610(+)
MNRMRKRDLFLMSSSISSETHIESHQPPPMCGEAVIAAITAQFVEWHHKFAHLLTDWSDFYQPSNSAFEQRMLDELTENGKSEIFSGDAISPPQDNGADVPTASSHETTTDPLAYFWFPSARNPNTFLFARTLTVPSRNGHMTYFVTKFGPKTRLVWLSSEQELMKIVTLAEGIDAERYILVRLIRPDTFSFVDEA